MPMQPENLQPENLLPSLAEEPRDLRGSEWGAENADEVIYRLGLHALPVPGLPEVVTVGDVEVSFVRGPVRAQRTTIRQRHQIPVVFDKYMTRLDIGDGELIAVHALRFAPVPADFEEPFSRWRAGALAAAGMIAAVLDERVVGEELFEDAILLRDGAFVGAADMHGDVRTYLPFDVTAADRFALDQLADVTISDSSAAARAARLYRRAALEGPTADGYAMLWVAAECFSDERSPSRKHLENALRDAGMDPDGLPISVGRLIGFRGEIQHQGLEYDARLKVAFYEMEAVVRALIRRDADLRGGWWPASDNPAAFADPFKPAVYALQDRGTTVWHPEALPPTGDPTPLRLPRQVPNPHEDPRIDLDSSFGETGKLVASVVVDAIEWQAPEMTLSVNLGPPDGAPPDATYGANATAIWISPSLLEGIEDPEHPEVLFNLVWTLHSLVGIALAQHEGIVSEGDGVVAIQAIGEWFAYQRLVSFGEFEEDAIGIPSSDDPIALGKIAGRAAAGHKGAQCAAEALPEPDRTLVGELIDNLRENEPGPATRILETAAERNAAPGSDTNA
jgi:hypothetical protein